ncbi:MAG: efflux RND transporter periplasmic adaptor subunit [Verrucomicrobia bacterium]|nr:efflux RND transporter periplasmic adaptor subunit [Verrucomicrobiota bacterium]
MNSLTAGFSLLTSLIGIILVFVALAGAFWFGTRSGHDHSGASAPKVEQLYTCGMHPQVIQNKPGTCPICAMKLTPVRKQPGGAGERQIKYYKSTMNPGEVSQSPGKDSMGMDMVPVYEESAAESATIAIDPVTIQNMAIRTERVTMGPLRRTVRTVGVIDFDETGLAQVTTKFKGWIEKLYVDATGSHVHRGEPLFEIYSPELYSAQVEYLLAIRQGANAGSGAEALLESARLKLRYLDISDEQIAELEKTGKPKKTLQVFAPIDGFVVEKMIVEGQMVEAGMTLYKLANLSLVWVQCQVYEKDMGYLKLGQEAAVTLSYLQDRKFRGRVTYIYPTVDEKTRTAKVRMEFHNPGYLLKPGMFASVELQAELAPSALLVPDMAILRSGEKNTVFVALDGGKFDPRTITLGSRAEDDMYQVLSGLNEGERVVTSGQFMLDSESQLREAIQKMLHPKKPGEAEAAAHAGHEMQSPTPAAASATAAAANPHAYVCPMPEHVSIEYQHPGKCPLCEMTLVPVSAAALAKMQPGGKVEYYTCPMPEHIDVKLDKFGKCPKCGMTLIPVMPEPAPPAKSHAGHSAMAALPSPLYTCPMEEHADVVSDKPGQCPKCEMKLVETTKVKHAPQAEENWRKQHPTPAHMNAEPQLQP